MKGLSVQNKNDNGYAVSGILSVSFRDEDLSPHIPVYCHPTSIPPGLKYPLPSFIKAVTISSLSVGD
jgi:hypothetical protein